MPTVICGCEESQAVTIEFRKMGIEAFSCDTQPCSGGHPEWHIQEDVRKVMKGGLFITQSGKLIEIRKWHLAILFPPCTHLALSGAAWFEKKRADGRQQQAIDFFMDMVNAPVDRICIENPMGIMGKLYKKPTQIIQPFYFGDEARKTTCLWLKNLPPLYHNKTPNLFDSEVTHVGEGEKFYWTDGKTGKQKSMPLWYAQAKGFGGGKATEHGKVRSKTFNGIAVQMAKQWGKLLLTEQLC